MCRDEVGDPQTLAEQTQNKQQNIRQTMSSQGSGDQQDAALPTQAQSCVCMFVFLGVDLGWLHMCICIYIYIYIFPSIVFIYIYTHDGDCVVFVVFIFYHSISLVGLYL